LGGRKQTEETVTLSGIIERCHQAGCKNNDVAAYLNIGTEALRVRQRKLGLPPLKTQGVSYAPKARDVIETDKIDLIRERDMLRIEVEILRKERSKLIEEGAL
jgi:hypothetical protein